MNDLFDAAGAILRQYGFNTYGELSAYEWFTDASGDPLDAPDNAVGFQGLFFDRIAEPGTIPAFEIGAKGVYLTPNRTYDPELGRWLQRDPNATAQPILAYAASMGQTLALGADAFDVDSLYSDGANFYQFALSNPITGRDPLGLSADFDWFAETEAVSLEIIGSKVAAREAIHDSAKFFHKQLNTALLMGQLAVSMMPGGDAVILMGKLAAGKDVTLEDVIYAGLSVGGAAIAGKLIGKFFKWKGAYKAGKATGRAHIAPILGRGSTGRTIPRNLHEQLAMEAAMADPTNPIAKTLDIMSDARWPKSQGWVKRVQNINGVEIHWVWNTVTDAVDDFKFVD